MKRSTGRDMHLSNEHGGSMQIVIIVLSVAFLALVALFLDFVSVGSVRRMTTMAADAGALAGAEAIAEELNRAQVRSGHPEEKLVTPCVADPQPWKDVLASRYLQTVLRVRSVGVREAQSFVNRNRSDPFGVRAYVEWGRRWREHVRGSINVAVPAWRIRIGGRQHVPSIVGDRNVEVKAAAEAIAYPDRGRAYVYVADVVPCEEAGAIFVLRLHAEWRVNLVKTESDLR